MLLTKEGKQKRYWDRIKQYRQNRGFENKRKKFYRQVGGECQQLDGNEAKQFWSKIWERTEHNRKTECINNLEKE